MNFYDLHVHSAFSEGESSLEQLASTAKKLGYKGICFAEYYKNDAQMSKLKTEIQKVKEKIGIEVFLGFEALNLKELETLRQKRKQFDVLLAHGGDLRMNRVTVETPEVDILTHPEMDRQDSGLNHVLVKLAARNKVAIEINFRQVLLSSKKTRSKVLENMQENIFLCQKFKTPIILCSGSISHWELRDPQTIVSFVSRLGLELKDAKNSLSKIPERIIEDSKERRGGKWVMPGVKVIK